MEELVAPYVDALEAHLGSSPCVLVGVSFAGLMAFEAARQLKDRRGKPALVIIVDTPARPLNPLRVAWHIWRRDWKRRGNAPTPAALSEPMGSRVSRSSRTAWWLLGKAMEKMKTFVNPSVPSDKHTGIWDEHGLPLPWAPLDRLYTHIDKSYRPVRIDSEGLLICTEASLARAYDETMGWKGLFTRGLETRSIVGDHEGIYREDVPALAKQISDATNRRSASTVTLLCSCLTGLLAVEIG
jgi:thioesterase domain-containing protein